MQKEENVILNSFFCLRSLCALALPMNRSSESGRGLPHSKTQARAACLPGFREVLDCASPLALWLPLQKWVHGTDARPILEVEALHEPCSSEREFAHFRRRSEPTHVGCYQAWFMVPMRFKKEMEASHELAWQVHGPDARPVLEVEAVHET
jgi:hypothetical protein